MEYDYSYMAVLDGRDGSELWTLNSTHTGMMSGLSLQAHTPGEDAMVFIALGRQSDSQTPTPTPQTAPSNQTTTQNLVEGLSALRVGLDTNPDSPRAEPHHEGPNEGEGGNPAQTRSRRSKDANPRYQDQQRPGGKPRPKDEKCRSVFEAAVSEVCRREEWWEVERVRERERRHGEDEEDRGSGVEDGAGRSSHLCAYIIRMYSTYIHTHTYIQVYMQVFAPHTYTHHIILLLINTL